MIHRTLQDLLVVDLQRNKKSVLLLGPRQVGKSTLCKNLGCDLNINLSDQAEYRQHLNDDQRLRRHVEGLKQKNSVVLIDEIQRLPTLLNTVQALVDEYKSIRFLLTGSSARKLKRGQANLLPGRIFTRHLFPLTWWELQDSFDLELALTRGTLPEIYLNDYGPELLSNYIDIYLREEIQAEALTRRIDFYSRFLNVSSEISGKEINYSKLSSDSEIPKETFRRFYDILEETLIVHRIKGFTAMKGSRKAVQKEKFVYFDMGVKNAILKQHRNEFTPTQFGELFEQWVLLQLIAYAKYRKQEWEFFYYRDDLQNEIDWVVDTGNSIIALEVKYSATVKKAFFDPLVWFGNKTKKPLFRYIVYRGKTIESFDGIKAIPYDRFFEKIETFI